MSNCEQTGNHIGYKKQYDLEHFNFIVSRCQMCNVLIECKAFSKEDKSEKSIE